MPLVRQNNAAVIARVPLPKAHNPTPAASSDTDIPPIETPPTTEIIAIGDPLDADDPHYEAMLYPGNVTYLGPPIDADDPLGMAQLSSTEMITIGEPMSADEELC